MTTVLLTGFEPFAAAAVNPSWQAAQLVASSWAGSERVIAVELPVAFARSGAALRAALDEHRPDLVIAVGLAEGRAAVTPERVALNIDDARIPDNDGDAPIDEPIDPDGPAARFTSLPVKAIVSALSEAGVPASLSNTAGTYVCNHVMYELMRELESRPGSRGGFIHVPATPELGADAVPTLELEQIADGIRVAVIESLAHDSDLRLPGGAIH